ncbi:interferon gamma precursor [Mesocricetus auratus]|uniref:Interferon gamma n=2 Tax=Mesocricetus auratus TaxID=10036 RepID=IFNG_MESAU|nr:interferon gamma precursor [Mesocricetus auratus]O35497.1 RecName: Full=Interferon gamma; Short=IFN-gamma; Flags: Precursor [Mesocricetus auratus]AAC53580.1 interferon gamma [Mesocricetus auratus]
MHTTRCILALLLCLTQAMSGCYCQGTLIEEIENLKKYFNSSSLDVVNGGDLVFNILTNWQKAGDTKIIESQIVSFYFKLFEALKDNQAIQRSIDTIKADLFANFFNSSMEKLNDFVKLTKIPVNDLQVQRKAVNELISVMPHLSRKLSLRKRKRSRCCFGGGNRPNKNILASNI